ncbi:MAG TPA: DUF4145 domain-containing protein [Candidatus Cloacimonadota bacterium]|nr:DUF4145 domain-containing protein [Candidatus Cloacimonadota bacterium]HPT71697.1 DUF4145 domain-containing protein [Candidatus Cloacimonadota bacterium]
MKCPHCLLEINQDYTEDYIGKDADGFWSVFHMICPNDQCSKLIISLKKGNNVLNYQGGLEITGITYETVIWPRTSYRPPALPEVDVEYAKDFNEACLILDLSPKASAALSRRCLHNLLINRIGIKKANLFEAIQELIDQGTLPSHIIDNLDAIRKIGNFALHPKTTSSGEILDVEPHEAEWLLDILEDLFDFYFVLPAKSKARREKLNEKLDKVD